MSQIENISDLQSTIPSAESKATASNLQLDPNAKSIASDLPAVNEPPPIGHVSPAASKTDGNKSSLSIKTLRQRLETSRIVEEDAIKAIAKYAAERAAQEAAYQEVLEKAESLDSKDKEYTKQLESLEVLLKWGSEQEHSSEGSLQTHDPKSERDYIMAKAERDQILEMKGMVSQERADVSQELERLMETLSLKKRMESDWLKIAERSTSKREEWERQLQSAIEGGEEDGEDKVEKEKGKEKEEKESQAAEVVVKEESDATTDHEEPAMQHGAGEPLPPAEAGASDNLTERETKVIEQQAATATSLAEQQPLVSEVDDNQQIHHAGWYIPDITKEDPIKVPDPYSSASGIEDQSSSYTWGTMTGLTSQPTPEEATMLHEEIIPSCLQDLKDRIQCLEKELEDKAAAAGKDAERIIVLTRREKELESKVAELNRRVITLTHERDQALAKKQKKSRRGFLPSWLRG